MYPLHTCSIVMQIYTHAYVSAHTYTVHIVMHMYRSVSRYFSCHLHFSLKWDEGITFLNL